MRFANALLATLAFAIGLGGTVRAGNDTPAKELFGAAKIPATLAARSIGSYAKGCLAGAIALPVNGETWQVMRLSRNRNWGNPFLVEFLEKLAKKTPSVGWNGLMVGDMAQPRGGPMLTGHASHQIGLDADIWLTPMPNRELTRDERETISPPSMVAAGGKTVDPSTWTEKQFNVIRLAASQKEVARIFVNPAIKKQLCAEETGDRTWLRTVRPWAGHDYHMHIRLDCPADSPGCKPQDPPPPGDGCGAELDAWFKPPPKSPKPPKPEPPPKPMTLRDLPPECSTVLVAN